MRDERDVFHLAIPVHDLDEARRFYVDQLGCHLARGYPDRITLDFFGEQVVCHLSNEIVPEPALYPRHFGITFRHREDFDRVLFLAQQREIRFFQDVKPRFEHLVEEHLTFVLQDPSNNLIEFKHYRDPRMMW
ncbi:MAG TPA: VOC family protein [Acidimicrobiales bacterium]|nr:VOC family protein [Acidimicrobiales bacterium]